MLAFVCSDLLSTVSYVVVHTTQSLVQYTGGLTVLSQGCQNHDVFIPNTGWMFVTFHHANGSCNVPLVLSASQTRKYRVGSTESGPRSGNSCSYGRVSNCDWHESGSGLVRDKDIIFICLQFEQDVISVVFASNGGGYAPRPNGNEHCSNWTQP